MSGQRSCERSANPAESPRDTYHANPRSEVARGVRPARIPTRLSAPDWLPTSFAAVRANVSSQDRALAVQLVVGSQSRTCRENRETPYWSTLQPRFSLSNQRHAGAFQSHSETEKKTDLHRTDK